MRIQYSVYELCEALEISRSGFYAWRNRMALPGPRATQNTRLKTHIMRIHSHRHTRFYGSPRMTAELNSAGFPCSVNRVAKLMRSDGIRARPRSPFRPKTTQPDHAACPSPNLLAKADPPQRPGEQLVSDITYVPTREGWMYLAVVIDLYSRAIMGWDLSDSLCATGTIRAIRQTIVSGQVHSKAIFHSDRGCQYTSRALRQAIARPQWRQSMSAKGYCYDNAFAESYFASFKAESIPESGIFETRAQARIAIFDYIETFYNRRRRHSSLGMISPDQALKLYFSNQNQSDN